MFYKKTAKKQHSQRIRYVLVLKYSSKKKVSYLETFFLINNFNIHLHSTDNLRLWDNLAKSLQLNRKNLLHLL